MAIDTTTPRSRRSLLMGLTGGLVGAAAASLGRAQAASAHDPDDVRLGAANSATYRTTITNTTPGALVIEAIAGGSGVGVHASSPDGAGVYGYAQTGDGVIGQSGAGHGVTASSNKSFGVYATSNTGIGVYGEGTGLRTNVHGVFGRSQLGIGVFGESKSGDGLHGSSESGTGVDGISSHVGVQGKSTATTGEHYGVYGESHSELSRGVFGRAMVVKEGTGVWG